LDELILKGHSAKEVIEISNRDDFFDPNLILDNLNNSLNILREKEQFTHVKMADFIENNYAKERLFHTPRHLSATLFKELMRQILALMNLPNDSLARSPLLKKERNFAHRLPIYPCVAKALNLTFNIEKGTYYKFKNISYEKYVRKYIEYLFPELHKNPKTNKQESLSVIQ
jgi:hypothetical protein